MQYLSPGTAGEALAILREKRPTIVAGCTDYLPSRRPGDATRDILDLTRVRGLRGITRIRSGWRIGAMTTWTDVLRADLPPAFDALKQAAREVGSIQIQNAGTVAGNLCNASPAADGAPPLLALGAEVEVSSAGRIRRLPLAAFITGVRSVDLSADEMVTAVHVPEVAPGTGGAFLKLGGRAYLVISIAMVAAVVRVEAGRIVAAAVAVGACSPVAQRLPALEAFLEGTAVADLPGLRLDPGAHLGPLAPIDDVRGSAAYRRQAVAELCRRAVARAAAARGGNG